MNTVPNVDLMNQKAEECGSHDNIFEIPAPRTNIDHCGCPSQQPINVRVCFRLIGRGEVSNQPNMVLSSSSNGKPSSFTSSILNMTTSANLSSQPSIVCSSMQSQIPMATPSSNPSGKLSSMPSRTPKDSLVFDNKLGEGCNMTLNESPFLWLIDFDWINTSVLLLIFTTAFEYIFLISLVMTM